MEQLLETNELKTRLSPTCNKNEIQKSKFFENNPKTLHC